MIDTFAESITPTSLNKHVLDGISGGDFSALMTSLKFLGLINEKQAVKPELRELVEARKRSESEYQSRMSDIVTAAYYPIVKGVDIDHGSLPELEKAFKDAGVPQGQMLTKVTRFYVKALEDCGVKVSDYITKPRVRPPTKNRGTKPPKKSKAASDTDGDVTNNARDSTSSSVQDSIPKGFERLTMPGMKDAFIQYPSNLSKRDYDLLKAMLTVLGTYISLDENEEGKKP